MIPAPTTAMSARPAIRPGSLLVHRRPSSWQVEEVLHVPHALDAPRPLDELLQHVRIRNLAAQLDDAVLRVDVDLPLRHVRVAEDLRLHLVRERGVVVVLRHLLTVLDLLRHPVDAGADAAPGPLGAPARPASEAGRAIREPRAPPPALLRVAQERAEAAEDAPDEELPKLPVLGHPTPLSLREKP